MDVKVQKEQLIELSGIHTHTRVCFVCVCVFFISPPNPNSYISVVEGFKGNF